MPLAHEEFGIPPHDRLANLDEDGLSFLWLELTNQCNLQCVHCYSDSHPHSGHRDRLAREDYEGLIAAAAELGCRQLQFIGGEPQLNRDLPHLVEFAAAHGFTFIEIYTNLTRLPADLLEVARRHSVHFATSVYSAKAEIHDAITCTPASHARTMRNLHTLVEQRIPVRAGLIVIDQHAEDVAETTSFLNRLGVEQVGIDHARGFGRQGHDQLNGLCGHCWKGQLCIAPDGSAFPCSMSRAWLVGNVLDKPLAEIVNGLALRSLRRRIHDEVYKPRREGETMCEPWYCNPAGCQPSQPGPCTPHAPCTPDQATYPCLPR